MARPKGHRPPVGRLVLGEIAPPQSSANEEHQNVCDNDYGKQDSDERYLRRTIQLALCDRSKAIL